MPCRDLFEPTVIRLALRARGTGYQRGVSRLLHVAHKGNLALRVSLILLFQLGLGLPPVLWAAEDYDLPKGYEAAPIAGGRARPKPAAGKKAKEDQAFEVGGGVIGAFEELLEKKADQKPPEKVDPRVLNLERQFRPQFEKLFKAERYRVRLVCDWSPERRRLLARESDRLLNGIVRTYCLAENQRRHGGLQRKPGLDPQQLIRDRVARLVREQFGPDEAGRYFEANRQCRQQRQRVTLLNMVAHFDQQLVLTAAQRERLTESLTAHWQDAWGQALPLFMHGAQFVPRIPDSIVLPLLDETQKTVWRGLPKQNQQVFWGNLAFGQRFGVVEEDEP